MASKEYLAKQTSVDELTSALAAKQDLLTPGDNITIEQVGDNLVISGEQGGTNVSIIPTLAEGTKIADYLIDGVSGELYAPVGGGGSVVNDYIISRTVTHPYSISSNSTYYYNNANEIEEIEGYTPFAVVNPCTNHNAVFIINFGMTNTEYSIFLKNTSSSTAEANFSYSVLYKRNISGSSYFAPEIYSTDEQVVGTWIDGKPLYQKTFKIEDSSVSNNLLADLDIKFLISGYFLIWDAHEFKQIPIQYNDSTKLITNNPGANWYLAVIVRYTKTTD